MPIIPHAIWFFDSVGLLLRADANSSSPAPFEWEMDVEEAVRYIEAIGVYVASDRRDGGKIFASPLTVGLLGGEPLAQPAALNTLLDCVGSYSLAAEVWTTGAWIRDRAQAEEILTPLRKRVHALRLHTNARLISGPGGLQVETLLAAARAVGIMVDTHCAVAPGLPMPRKLLALETVNNNTSFIHFDPAYDVLTDSRAAQPESDGEFFLSSPSRQRCAEKFGFYVAPGGTVYPCWAGVGYDALRIGDLSCDSVADIVHSATIEPGVVRLREHGPRHLYLELSREQMDAQSGRYADNCDFHRQLLGRTSVNAGPAEARRPA